MKLKTFLFTILLAVPTLAMADKGTDKTADKAPPMDKAPPADKAPDKATDKTADKAALSEDDAKVVAHVKHVNDMEIEVGKLAKANGTAQVKAYGATLVKDHTANNRTLAALAKKKGISTIPDEAPATEEQKLEHQKMMDGVAKLRTLKGATFDRELLPMMIEGHDMEVGRLDAAIASVKDADVVAHLKATKPVIQRHADAARELQKKAVSMK